MHHRLGLRSLLTHRLHLAGEPETVAALNLYSDAPDAFEESAAWGAGLLGAHGALAVSAQLAEQQAARLERSLPRTREIGVAVGVLMARYGSTRDEALELLRRAGRDSHQPVAAIAAEVIDSEVHRLPPMPTSLGAPWNHIPPA
nr:ANTAR domain-containing protein [Kocuria sediminis]